MARRFVSPTLVGRETELATLGEALRAAIEARPVHQLISGEAGVGKSRLVAELATVASVDGVRVLTGHCINVGDGGVPYGPVVEALRTLVGELEPADLDRVVGTARVDLARLVPSLGPSEAGEPGGQSESQQARLLDAVLGLLQRLAGDGPVLFVVEDLHWADPATRETIGFLVRHLRADRVLLVLTFRADELHRRHPLLPWLAELDRSGRVERLDLDRLDPGQTTALVAAIRGDAPPADLVDRINRRSEGNPFFVEELMAADDGRTGPLPPTLREVLLARIVALPEATQTVIGVAAVAGRPLDHALLAKVAAMDDGVLMEALRAAVESQVLVAGSDGASQAGDYTFRHALLREAAYDDLLPGERQRLHRVFADALAEEGPGNGALAAGHWAELAYHWSATRDNERAFEASVRAGDAAAAAYAFADARRHNERALELWSSIDAAAEIADMDRVELVERTAVAAWLSGDARRSVALRKEAVAALEPDADPIRLGKALEQLGRALWYYGDSDAALEACEAALAVMPANRPTPEGARVLSGYGQLLMLLDRWPESIDACRRAIEMATEVGARAAEGHARNTLGLDLSAEGDCSGGLTYLGEALAIAREVSNPDDIGRAYVNTVAALLYCGDFARASAVWAEGVAAAAEVGVAGTYGRFVQHLGIAIEYERGEWATAHRLADLAFAVSSPVRQQQRYGLARYVPLLVAEGADQAEARLEELRVLLDGFRVETQFNVPYRIAAAEFALWRGDAATAFESIQRGLAETPATTTYWYLARIYRVGMQAVADRAEIARARRDRAAEAAAIEDGNDLWERGAAFIERATARQQATAREQTLAERSQMACEHRRLLGQSQVADWDDAARRWEARGNPYLEAYCRWREAEAALVGGDRSAANRALGQAHGTAVRLGARPLATAIEDLATRSRLDLSTPATADAPAPDVPADPFGLTPRERDVLPLLVKGRTNRQIADELFISENTAGVHVSNILGKLGAASRTEAAGIAARLGLGGD